MGKRRSDHETGAVLLIIVLAAVVAVCGPIAILAFWMKSEWDARNLPKPPATDHLQPNSAEWTELDLSAAQAAVQRAAAEKAFEEGVVERITRRADGLFDGRIRRGRELNEEITYARADAEGWERRHEKVCGQISKRQDAWSTALAQRSAARFTVCSYIGIAIWLAVGDRIQKWIALSALSVVGSVIIGMIAFYIIRSSLRKLAPTLIRLS